MTDRMLTVEEAAEYCRLPLAYLQNQMKHRTGPAFVAVSKRVRFFRKQDLDAWIDRWDFKVPLPRD